MTITPTKKDIYFAGFKIVFAHHMAFTGDRLYDRRRFDKDAQWEKYAPGNGFDVERGVLGDTDNAFKDKTNKQVFYQAMLSAFNFVNDPEHKKNIAK